MVCAVLVLYTESWYWHRCPEIGTSSIDWAQLRKFYLKTETECSLRNVVFCNINRTLFLDKYRTMDNVLKHNICTRSEVFTALTIKSNIFWDIDAV
jgi:hypothetical protein